MSRLHKLKRIIVRRFAKAKATLAHWFSRENLKKVFADLTSGAKAKIILTVVICLLFALPVTVLFFALSSPSLPSVANYDYLAMTDCYGKEYIYKSSDITFLTTASAFSTAKHTRRPPDWWSEDMPSVKLEFIEDGYAYPYSLYLNPFPLAAYLTDASGSGYLLRNDSAAVLINAAAVSTSLVGDLPPDITLNGENYGFSVCSWTFYILPDFGAVFTVSSGEYLSERKEPYPVNLDSFSCSFAEQPTSLSFRIFRGEDKILDTIAPDFSSLPAGEYQLVVLAEFDRGLEAVRAGYSFSFTVD